MALSAKDEGTVTPRFQAGGALRPGSLYVRRDADDELRQTLLCGEFAYVLAPRQIGKSSLRLRAEKRLVEEGVAAFDGDGGGADSVGAGLSSAGDFASGCAPS